MSIKVYKGYQSHRIDIRCAQVNTGRFLKGMCEGESKRNS